MSINRKKPNIVPNTRDVKKAKKKWEEKKNLQELKEYIKKLWATGKIEEIENLFEKAEIIFKNKESFVKTIFMYVCKYWDKLSKKTKENWIDKYLLSQKDKLPNHDFIKVEPEIKKFIKSRIKVFEIKPVKQAKIEKDEKNHKISPIEELIKLSSSKKDEDLSNFYKIFLKNKTKNWLNNKDLIKTIFKAAKNYHKYDKQKSQKLLDFCRKANPKNGNFNAINNKWNERPILKKSENKKEKIIEEKAKDILKVIPLEKQIYTANELFDIDKNLKNIFDSKTLKNIIDEFPTCFRKNRKWPSILIYLANNILNSTGKADKAWDIYLSIESLLLKKELKEKEVKASRILKYDILVVQEKFKEAETWNNNFDLGREPKIDFKKNVISPKKFDKNDEMFSKFFEINKQQSIKYYRERVDYYINNDQFKYKLGEEISDVVMNSIKNKIANDLKYLDFEIRELLIPYFIKIEADAKVVLDEKIRKNNFNKNIGTISLAIKEAYNNYREEMRFIIDVSKIKEKKYTNKQLFYQFLLAFRVIRNHMVHGGLNLFGLKINTSKNKKDGIDEKFEEAISIFSTIGDDPLNKIFEEIKKKNIYVDLFRLSIIEKISSNYAIEHNKIFGISLVILFMATSNHVFLRIGSEINNKINNFWNRTSFGSKAKLYESLGLNQNWLYELIEMNKI